MQLYIDSVKVLITSVVEFYSLKRNQFHEYLSTTEILSILFNFSDILAAESTFEQLLSCRLQIMRSLGLPFI